MMAARIAYVGLHANLATCFSRMPSRCKTSLKHLEKTTLRYASTFTSIGEYHKYADATMEKLSEEVDEICEDHPEGATFDVASADGVLTVDLSDHGIFVINKQTPNQQIWLSSPLSGPKRYDYDRSLGGWTYSHDDVTLHNRLSEEFTELLGQSITFEVPGEDEV